MRDIILVDLDDTLNNSQHRQHLIEHPMKTEDWDVFHANHIHDRPTPILPVIRALSMVFPLVGITGRCEIHQETTVDWLAKHNIYLHRLLMRPHGDHGPAPEMKRKLLLKHFSENQIANIVCIIDDHEGVCEEFTKRLDIPSLQVRLPNEPQRELRL